MKIFDNADRITDTVSVANAIRYACQQGARVASNSWQIERTTPVVAVANAIRDVSNNYNGPGCVMVFAAGNSADFAWSQEDVDVQFPANMPEVIAVGAVKNTGTKWDYSCYGSALDIVAPSGNDGDEWGDTSTESSLWTVDQLYNLGWNPVKTGPGDAVRCLPSGGRDCGTTLGPWP